MSDMTTGTPRYRHDCQQCVFLGSFEQHDLYYCPQGEGIPTVIARYGDEGPKYTSGLHIGRDATPEHPLAVAYGRARKRGLNVLDREERERLNKAAPDLLAVARMAMQPERDSCDQYDDWHARLREAASAAIAKATTK